MASQQKGRMEDVSLFNFFHFSFVYSVYFASVNFSTITRHSVARFVANLPFVLPVDCSKNVFLHFGARQVFRYFEKSLLHLSFASGCFVQRPVLSPPFSSSSVCVFMPFHNSTRRVFPSRLDEFCNACTNCKVGCRLPYCRFYCCQGRGKNWKKKEYLMLAECLSVRGRLSSMRAGVRWPQMKSVIGFRFDSIEHLIRIVVMVLLYWFIG